MEFVAKTSAKNVRRIAVLGAGTIGSGWAVHFLRCGFEVRCWDPISAARESVRDKIDAVWPLAVRNSEDKASPDGFLVCDQLEDALQDVDFIQENALENLALKQELFAQIDAHCSPGVVVASSTSGLLMTDMQANCRYPERFAMGHPFNPPWLIPLVEVCGGSRTSKAAEDWLEEFYTYADKTVLRVMKERPSLIVNHLQDVIFREALRMVAMGEATVEQVDMAITKGPALRWPFNGPMEGTEIGWTGGMEAYAELCFSEDGPGKDWFGDDVDIPALKKKLVEGCRAMMDGRDLDAIRRQRWRNVCAVADLVRDLDGA
ncbi:MAG: 3-hydroxyacyl-CoA dehydrogenase NAD-binding domain-containing protein [Pseudomonadota bacterium]